MSKMKDDRDLKQAPRLRRGYTTGTCSAAAAKAAAAMLFSGEEALKKVKVLSGGEKVRCILSKLMLSGANFLIFDEPTNHLDMEAITALNEGMQKYKGIMMFTSHDHQLTQTVANKIIDITGNNVVIRECTYDEYLAEKGEID